MRKSFKKVVAVAMAATMVVGSNMMAFAAESTGLDGTGSSTGHLDKKVISVTFPTLAANDTTFDYTVDAEGLIKAAGDKYKGAAVTLPTSNDTGVYFLTKTANTYANTSEALEVINKSSHSVEVSATAKAEVADGATMMTLADSATISGTDPKLYLGISVSNGTDTDTKAITEAGVTAKATVAGYAANYEVKSNADGSFSYGLKDSPDETKWSKASISLTGACNAVTNVGTAVAPKVVVTWTAVDPSATAAPSIATTTYNMVADTASTVAYSLGLGDLAATEISSVIWVEGAPTLNLLSDAQFVVANASSNTFTLTAKSINNMIAAEGDEQTIKVTFDDGTIVNLTFNDPS